MTVLWLGSWYLLTSAWVYAQYRAAMGPAELLPGWWSALLGVVLTVAPWGLVVEGLWALVLSVPLVCAALLAWPMALRVVRRTSVYTPTPSTSATPDHVARERARMPELHRATQDTLEIVHRLGTP